MEDNAEKNAEQEVMHMGLEEVNVVDNVEENVEG